MCSTLSPPRLKCRRPRPHVNMRMYVQPIFFGDVLFVDSGNVKTVVKLFYTCAGDGRLRKRRKGAREVLFAWSLVSFFCRGETRPRDDASSLCFTQVKTKCVNKACQAELIASQERMVVETGELPCLPTAPASRQASPPRECVSAGYGAGQAFAKRHRAIAPSRPRPRLSASYLSSLDRPCTGKAIICLFKGVRTGQMCRLTVPCLFVFPTEYGDPPPPPPLAA